MSWQSASTADNKWAFQSAGTGGTGNCSIWFDSATQDSSACSRYKIYYDEGQWTSRSMGLEEYGWVDFPKPKPVRHAHELHKFRYAKGEVDEKLGPTQRLAPLDEEIEIAPREALRHLKRLLSNPRYRAQQLRKLNRANKALDLPLVSFDAKTVKDELRRLRIKFQHSVRTMKKLKRIQDKAEKLLRCLLPVNQYERFRDEKRIELVARNGNIYEILADGRVNKLLPDGKKQGLCIIPKGGPYPVADIVLMKKLLIESAPEMLEDIAHKTAAFPLVEVRR